MIRKLFFILFATLSLNVVHATGEFFDAFMSHYKVADSSPLATKSCGICHVSDSDFAKNPYGEAVKAKMEAMGKTAVDGDVLAALDAEDADGDGTPNGAEIAAGTFPGDPTSGAKPGAKIEPPKPKKPEGMIPKNGFHPAIVHFPIALFIAGLVLDAIGMVMKDKTMLLAGWYNLILAAMSTIGGIGSGLLAMTLKGYPFSGTFQQHVILAVISSVIMWVLVAMRLHRHEKMNVPIRVVYYILAFAALFLVSWAGHVGGDLVYG